MVGNSMNFSPERQPNKELKVTEYEQKFIKELSARATAK